jgi:hypothetical protein
MPRVKLDHCVVAVSDWARSNEFYARVLGAEVVPACGRRAIVNARIAHREHADQSIVNGKIGIVNARIGHREQQDRSS